MKTFEIDVNLNGKMTFEVKAKNKSEAKKMVDKLLGDTSVKEALEKYQNTLFMDTKIKNDMSLER